MNEDLEFRGNEMDINKMKTKIETAVLTIMIAAILYCALTSDVHMDNDNTTLAPIFAASR